MTAKERIKLARKSQDPKILTQLSKDKTYDVRSALARNPSTPPDILHQCVLKGSRPIKFYVAQNPSTSIETLDLLSRDDSHWLRVEVAARSRSDWNHFRKLDSYIAILRRLSKDAESSVREQVAENRSTPQDILEILSRDKFYGARKGVAQNPNASADILLKLSKDEMWEVRKGVAKNHNASAEALHQLSRDKENWVRYYVAINPFTPIETLSRLTKDSMNSEYAKDNPKWRIVKLSGLHEVAELASKWLRII